MKYPEATEIKTLLDQAQKIVVIQADNPDGDSLASSLALEQILGEQGKNVVMYCAVDIPLYLRYLLGWDRVQKDLPTQFDAAVIVDVSTVTLLEKLQDSGQLSWLATKPCVVLDHHGSVDNPITFAKSSLIDPSVSSTGQLIYNLARDLSWPLDKTSAEFIMTSILGDTQGLTNDLAGAETYRVMAELVDLGAKRPELEEKRRELSKMPGSIYRYKGELIKRTELAAEGQIASVTIPQNEITEFSPLYNPAPLIQADMLQIENVALAIVFKRYDDGKITAAIRANNGYDVANQLADHFGGGGHPYAAGFKIVDGQAFDKVKSECVVYAAELLDKIAT
jgi:phosphoesterase RecJ-like protein